MKKRNIMAIICSMAMAAGVLSGCGNSSASADVSTAAKTDETSASQETADAAASQSGTAETAQTDETSAEEVSGTLSYWTYTDNANQLVDAFKEKYPNVNIDLQVFGGDEYKTKILTTLQSGENIPDLFDLEEGYMYEFLDSDLIADLSYVNIEELTKNYYPYQIAAMKDSKGAYKTLTFESNPVCFWYLRDACEKWLGTSDPDEISAMITSWDDLLALQKKVYEASDGKVYVFGNVAEMVKVSAFNFDPLVQDGKLVIGDQWKGLLQSMRAFYESGYDPELGSWGSDWATAWNDGTLLLRAMPSWDFFTDWDKNSGNVGLAIPFSTSFEGCTGVCVYNDSPNKDLAGTFIRYIASDEFQKINMDKNNQVPASKTCVESMAKGYSNPKFGGQNLIETYGKILDGIKDITPDKYTRAAQNKFQSSVSDGLKSGLSDDEIIADFKSDMKDAYPELEID